MSIKELALIVVVGVSLGASRPVEAAGEKPNVVIIYGDDVGFGDLGSYGAKLTYRGDAMVQLDWCAGEILKALDEQGLADNTLVIFSSDNGPVYDDGYEDGTTVRTSTKEVDRGHDGSGPFRGGKYQIYEGGTRVLFIVKWPGHVKPGESAAMVNQIDFIASFADLLDIGERKNVAKNHSAVARDMAELLKKLKQADEGIRKVGD